MEQARVEDAFLQNDLGSTIAEHALQCNDLFQRRKAMSDIAPDPTLMDDQLARFTLWTSNMDVFGQPNISLDYRLRYSPTVIDIIHELLDVIYESLTSLKPIDHMPRNSRRKKQRISQSGSAEFTQKLDDDSGNAESDEDQAQDNVSLITENIGGSVTRLFRLSNAIRISAKAKRTNKIRSYTDDEEANNAITELRLYTECYIRFRFPRAPEALRSELVEANALRLRRLYYQRSHRRRVALSGHRSMTNPTNVQLPKMPDRVTAVHFAPSAPLDPKPVVEKREPTKILSAPVTYATTARQTAVGALYADSVVETPRAKSVLVNNKLSFPPVPTTSECPYCGVVLDFKGTAKHILWNDHVTRDLEPFVCVFANCTTSGQQERGSLTFETSKAWMSHMQNAHRHAWECRAPTHTPKIFEQEIDFQAHSREEHGVAEEHVGMLSSVARRPVLEKILECPFGDDFSVSEKSEPNAVFSGEALRLHVAAHMKEIALLAIQKLPSDKDGPFEDVASDVPLQDGVHGDQKLRGSMYSVLDDDALDIVGEADDGAKNSLEEGINPSVEKLDLTNESADGMSILHRAVQDNNVPLVQSLIGQGADLHSRAASGRTALHYACLNSEQGTAMISLLLTFGGITLLSLGDDIGQTALHYAAKVDFVEGIMLLGQCGGDMNVLDDYGLSPLLWAVISGRYQATRVLISNGAHIDLIDRQGKSALSWAASLGHSSIIQILGDFGAIINPMSADTAALPLGCAAAFGDPASIQFLLERGSDVDKRDRDGWSAIHYAAEEGHFEVVVSLVQQGANVNAISSYGTSPLHCAANGGHDNVVIGLIRFGADPWASTCHGWTPVHHAAFMGHHRVVQSLLKYDETIEVDVSRQDNHGWTALHLAIHGRHVQTVRVLLENSVMPEACLKRDEGGLTPLEWLDLEVDSHAYRTISDLAFRKSRCCRAVTNLRHAVASRNATLTELFLEQGYDVNGANSGGRTALYYAAKNNNVSMLEMLLKHGADPNILPAGRRNWEDCVSNDNVLRLLRDCGYEKPTPDSMDTARIWDMIPRGQDSVDPGDEPGSSRSMGTAHEERTSAREGQRAPSRVTKLWKRMRGE